MTPSRRWSGRRRERAALVRLRVEAEEFGNLECRPRRAGLELTRYGIAKAMPRYRFDLLVLGESSGYCFGLVPVNRSPQALLKIYKRFVAEMFLCQ